MPRVKLVYQEHGEWAEPKRQPWGCPHPRDRLRFDGKFALPSFLYCRDCGARYIHPYHGLTEQEIAERKEEAAREIQKFRDAGWFQDEEGEH